MNRTLSFFLTTFYFNFLELLHSLCAVHCGTTVNRSTFKSKVFFQTDLDWTGSDWTTFTQARLPL